MTIPRKRRYTKKHLTVGGFLLAGILGSASIGIHEMVGIADDTTVVLKKHLVEGCQYKVDEDALYVICKVKKD